MDPNINSKFDRDKQLFSNNDAGISSVENIQKNKLPKAGLVVFILSTVTLIIGWALRIPTTNVIRGCEDCSTVTLTPNYPGQLFYLVLGLVSLGALIYLLFRLFARNFSGRLSIIALVILLVMVIIGLFERDAYQFASLNMFVAPIFLLVLCINVIVYVTHLVRSSKGSVTYRKSATVLFLTIFVGIVASQGIFKALDMYDEYESTKPYSLTCVGNHCYDPKHYKTFKGEVTQMRNSSTGVDFWVQTTDGKTQDFTLQSENEYCTSKNDKLMSMKDGLAIGTKVEIYAEITSADTIWKICDPQEYIKPL